MGEFDEAFAEHVADDYDKSDAWNQSSAWQLLSKSPMHAWHYRNKPRDVANEDHSRQREIGTVVHALLLGSTRGFREIDAENYRTKAAQEQRTQCEASGITPILAPDMSRARRTCARVLEQIESFGYRLDGVSELPLYWDEDAGSPLRCKARLDHVQADGLTILDIKTGEDANPRRLTRRILECGYHVQAAAYSHALVAQDRAKAGRVRFIDVFVETDGLALVTPVAITGSLLELGEKQWLRACRRWAECVAAAEYPGYTTETLAPEAPVWALNEEAMA